MTHRELSKKMMNEHGDLVRHAIPDFMLAEMGVAEKDYERERLRILRKTMRQYLLHVEHHFLHGGFNIVLNDDQRRVAFKLIWRRRNDL